MAAIRTLPRDVLVGFPSFSAIFNRNCMKLPLFPCILIRNEGKTDLRLLQELIVVCFMHVCPLDRAARLPNVEHRPVDNGCNRRLQVRILGEIRRIFAAKL